MLAADPLAALHNPINPRDVNGDGFVSPRDALLVINNLQHFGPHKVEGVTASFLASTSGSSSSAAYLLDVNGDNNVSPADALSVINFLIGDPQVQITTRATDLSGNPLTSIPVGGSFLLEADVQDVRNPVSAFPGVFAAYMNVSYDTAFSSIATNATVNFDPFFAVARTSNVSVAGQVIGTGAAASSLTAPGNGLQKLWTVQVTATHAGLQQFTPSFDTTAGHDVLLYGSDSPVPESDVVFVPGSILVVPSVSISSVSQAEGNDTGNPTPFVFTVSLSDPINQEVTVAYNTANPPSGNVATPGVDYQATSGTVTFAANETTALITVLVNGDTNVEPDELFDVVLSNPSGAALGIDTGLGTIRNDDSLLQISIGNQQVTNVLSGTTPMVFTVSLSGPAGATPVTVEYATSDITATAGSDYIATSGTLTFNTGISTQTITVTVLGSSAPANSEQFLVTLTNPSSNAALLVGSATGTILPAVPLANLSINNVTLPEGNAGTTPFVFTLSLSSVGVDPIVVAYSTLNGSASAPGDYAAQSGTVTFQPGEIAKAVTIAVVGDTDIEADETFTVNLTPISGTVGTVQTTATGTIQNDDGVPTILIGDVTVLSGTAGTNAVFTVTISSTVLSQVVVGYATQDNTALTGIDYLTQSGNLTFSPGGPNSQTITVPVLGQPAQGPDETFFVNLSSVSPGAVIGDAQAVGTIIRQGFTISSASLAEGNSGNTNMLFTVGLGLPRVSAVTVSYSTADGTATTADSDYLPTSGTLTFAAGQTSQVVTVQVVGDTNVEANETFSLNLSNAVGAAILSGVGTGTIVNDDGSQVQILLVLADPQGNPLPVGATLDVNDSFILQAYVQDVQVVPTGVAQAYVDAVYSSNLVQITGPITFGSGYPNVHSGDLNTAGLIDEAGGLGNLAPPAQPGTAQLLFSVPFKATTVGIASFTPDPADIIGHEIQVYGSDTPVPSNMVTYAGTSITIGANVLTVDSVSVQEGDSGTTNFVFTVSRIPPLTPLATVVYSTSDGTATAGVDYIPTSGTLTFQVGETSKTITVQVNGDSLDEADETFFVNLSNGVGASASQSPGTGTILDDDALPGLRVADATASEGQQLQFVVSMFQAGVPGPSGKSVTVAYHTANSTSGNIATAGTDYQPTSGTLTFAPGVSQLTIAVTAFNDLLNEPTETFQVILSDPVNATISDDTAQGNIVNVQPVEISGYVYVDSSGDGAKGNDKNGNPEVGIANVMVTATRTDGITPYTQTVLTAADGSYSLIGLPPGTYTVTETQPGFFGDGRDVHAGVESPINDQFSGIVVGPAQGVSGYNFGESTLRNEFVLAFFDRRAFFASAIVTGSPGAATSSSNIDLRRGEQWISFDGGWQGLRTITATFDAAQGSATMSLYNNNLTLVAVSAPSAEGAKLQYSGVTGGAYFLKLSGSNPNVSLKMDPATPSSAGPLAAPSASPAASPATSSSSSSSTAAAPSTSTYDVTAQRLGLMEAPTSIEESSADGALEEDEDWIAEALVY